MIYLVGIIAAKIPHETRLYSTKCSSDIDEILGIFLDNSKEFLGIPSIIL